MTQTLLVLQHHPSEGPGRIADWAARHGLRLIVIDATREPLPEPDPRVPWVVLGGPAQINDAPAWLRAELESTRSALNAGVPLLGICLGAQIIASALGAPIAAFGREESGWTPVRFADGTRGDVLQWHSQGFALPPGAEHLADSDGWPCQMYRLPGGRVVGMQFHPEWDAAMVERLRHAFGAACPLDGAPEPARQAWVDAWFAAQLDTWKSRW